MNKTLVSTTTYLALVFSLFVMTFSAFAKQTAQVMMLGSFHFSNPGLDVVKTSVIDVTTSENQQYLVQLSQSIALDFSPTHVLVECDPKTQGKVDEQYQSYVKGDYTLPVNETYQIGFRVGKFAGAQAITCYDELAVEWNGGPLMKSMPIDAPQIQSELEAILGKHTQDLSEMHKNKSLREILASNNQVEEDNKNKSWYLLTNSVGAGSTFIGADAAASWWHRNFRMYANIQKVAQPNTRVLVIGGQGHSAILKDFISLDTKIIGVDVGVFFHDKKK